MAKTLTAANAVIMIGVTGLFGVSQQLQGFATDDVYDVDQVDAGEAIMGVDGKLSGGLVRNPVKQNYTLQADSDSVDIFETLYNAQLAANDIYFLTGTTYLKSVAKKYSMRRGVLTGYSPLANAKKLLQPRKFTIVWEAVSPALF